MKNDENTKSGFLAMDAGNVVDKDGKIAPYAFMVEGIVANVGTFREASEGKAAILNLSVLVGKNPWALLGKDVEDEQADNANVNAEKPFVNLAIFGQDAGRLKDIQKYAKVVFCGRPVKNCYKRKQTGEDAAAVVINTDAVYRVQTKYGNADGLRRWVPSMINQYESKDGEVKNQNLGLVSCEVIKCRGVQVTQSGQEVASAAVRLAIPALEAEARINRTYQKDTNYGAYMETSISVWGPRASKMEKVLAPGNQLVILATAKKNVANSGLAYVNLTTRDISVMKWNDVPASAGTDYDEGDIPTEAEDPGTYDMGGGFPPILDDDEELDLPF